MLSVVFIKKRTIQKTTNKDIENVNVNLLSVIKIKTSYNVEDYSSVMNILV
jgi:hypothetical protein